MSDESKCCPFCGEEKLAVTIKCKHIGSNVDGDRTKSPALVTRMGIMVSAYTLTLILFLIAPNIASALKPEFLGLKNGLYLNNLKIGYYSDAQSSGKWGTTDEEFENLFIKALDYGFTGILFEITVSVDFEGKLLSNLRYDRLFDMIQLAESYGLGTGILPNWTFNNSNSAYVNENEIAAVSSTFSFDEFLSSIGSFWKAFAIKANVYEVDALHLGLFETPIFFSSDYVEKWSEIISDVRSAYSGALLMTFSDLQAHHKVKDFSIWGELDAISIWPKIFLTTEETYNVDLLQSLYWLPPLENDNYINQYISASELYNKPILLINNAFAIDNGLDGGWDPSQEQLEERPPRVNNEIRDLAYSSFLHHFSNHLFDHVTSWSFGNGEAWSANIPDDAAGGSWKYFDLSLFPETTMNIFKEFFAKDNYIKSSNNVFASVLSDTIYTRTGDYIIHTGGGFDRVHGGMGKETIYLDDFKTVISVDYKQWISTIGEHKVNLLFEDEVIHETTTIANSLGVEKGGYWQNIHFRTLVNSASPSVVKLYVPQESGFIEITKLEIINSLGSYNINPSDGSKTRTASWAGVNWLLNDDVMTYVLPVQQLEGMITIDGGGGIDTVIYPNNESIDYPKVNLSNIERISRNGYFALDIDGNAGDAMKILNLAFGEEGVANEVFRGAVLSLLDSGMSFNETLGLVVNYKFGNDIEYSDFITTIFNNVVGAPPSVVDLNNFVSLLDNGTYTVFELASLAANHELNVNRLNLATYRETGIPYIPYQ